MATEEAAAADVPATEVEAPAAKAAEEAKSAKGKKAAKERKAPKEKKAAKEKKPAAVRKPAAHPPYAEMITEAIATLKERTGASSVVIGKYVEEKHGPTLPPNFRKLLSGQLKKLVAARKLAKVKNSFSSPPLPMKPKPAAAVAKPEASPKAKAKTAAKPKPASPKAKAKTAAAPRPRGRPPKAAKDSPGAKKPAAPKKAATVGEELRVAAHEKGFCRRACFESSSASGIGTGWRDAIRDFRFGWCSAAAGMLG